MTALSFLAPPPRPVPAALRLQLLFGGFLNQFGWFFFGFGLIFFWAFAMQSDFTSWLRFKGPLESEQGSVTGCRDTRYSVGGSKGHRGTPIYANDYRFSSGGADYGGTSFATGRCVATGMQVTVEFPAGKPALSRIVGMRRAPMEGWAIFVALFPAVGLIFVATGLRAGQRAARLLASGKLAQGKLVEKSATNTQINHRTVYKMTFEFTTENGMTARTSTKTHRTELLEDDERENLIYDPDNPENAVTLDTLPAAVLTDEAGELRTGNPFPVLLALLVPGATLLGHGAWIYFHYFAKTL